MSYQVGSLICFAKDDPEFSRWSVALQHAIAKSKEGEGNIVGVWTGQTDGSELRVIVYEGQVFSA